MPDIGGIQSWIEKAWKAGFDVPGGEEFGNLLSGTEEWIGATECAALLRYFGIRAVVVDFSMNQEERKNRAAKLKETLARRNKTIYNKRRKKNDEYYPPKKNVKRKNSVISHNQSTTLDALVDVNGGNGLQTDISDNDNENDGDDNFENDDFQNETFQNGNGIKEHSFPIKDDVCHRNIPNNKNSNSDNSKIEKKMVMNEMKNEKESMSERVFNWVEKYHSLNMAKTDAGRIMLGGNSSKCQLKESVKMSRDGVIKIDIDEDGDFNNKHNHNSNDDNNKYDNDNNSDNYDNDNNYNNDNGYDNNISKNNNDDNSNNNVNSFALKSNTASSTSSSQVITNNKLTQKTSVLPLFFQHQGHSRTIVGKESFENNC